MFNASNNCLSAFISNALTMRDVNLEEDSLLYFPLLVMP